MTNPSAAASESEIIAECEAAIAEFTAQRDECLRRVRELMAQEDPANGIFHAQQIHALQQDKLRLDVEIEFKRKRINRIRLGIGESTGDPTAGGLLL
jgi:hypothetical protein